MLYGPVIALLVASQWGWGWATVFLICAVVGAILRDA